MRFAPWLAAFAAAAFMMCAQASAPMQRAQPPGFYRVAAGDIEVTALFDGTVDLEPTKLLMHTSPAHVERDQARAYEKEPLPTSVNAYLINTGEKLVLVDAGTGPFFPSGHGSVVANLKAAGYRPGQVDEIYLTHMHFDHVGGLAEGGKAVFPNAIVRADMHDADFWLDSANAGKAARQMQGYFAMAIASLQPYVSAGRFKPFDGDTPLVPGVRAQAARGHSPGHTVYRVESRGQTLVLWGDLMHVAAVQFAHPEVTSSSISTRRRPRSSAGRPMPRRRTTAGLSPGRTCRSPASAGCAPTAAATPSCRSTTGRPSASDIPGLLCSGRPLARAWISAPAPLY